MLPLPCGAGEASLTFAISGTRAKQLSLAELKAQLVPHAVEYHDPFAANMIKEFIRQPSKYRYTYMPDHLHLTERDLEDLYQYFRTKSRERRHG